MSDLKLTEKEVLEIDEIRCNLGTHQDEDIIRLLKSDWLELHRLREEEAKRAMRDIKACMEFFESDPRLPSDSRVVDLLSSDYEHFKSIKEGK